MIRRLITIAAATVAGLGLALTAFLAPAGASTHACNATGFCGTQADAQASPLYLTVAGKVANIHVGTLIIGQRPDRVTRKQDFWFDGLHGDLIHYAPYGQQSALCVAGHASGRVNLRPCDASQPTQSWTASATSLDGYFRIQNGRGQYLTMHFNGQPVTTGDGIPTPTGAPAPRQAFQFTEAPAA